MKHYYDWSWWIAIVCMWGAMAMNLVLSRRSWRMIRDNRKMRQVIWAYEKELRERGVTLPARCAYCCQVLPRHVDGCIFSEATRLRLKKSFKFTKVE